MKNNEEEMGCLAEFQKFQINFYLYNTFLIKSTFPALVLCRFIIPLARQMKTTECCYRLGLVFKGLPKYMQQCIILSSNKTLKLYDALEWAESMSHNSFYT
jgi:hypothetical protein